MCGITGMIKRSRVEERDKQIVNKMNEEIIHRGPDADGIFMKNNVVLGHRRLSILDLSEAGHQPMHYMNKYTIVLNGEIYNYLELKEELIDAGYTFENKTDTEVVMAAYDFWGTECFEKFNGMWALALYDHQVDKLILSRDRFGVKPLYYFRDERHIIFASEIKALLVDSSIERKANDDAIYDYLTQGLVDHTENTFFENIYQFPRASYVILDNDLQWNPTTFWELKFSDSCSGKLTEKLKLEFYDSFMNSVKLRLRSDVPVGSCLSGGLDSSAIVCAIDKINIGNSDKGCEQYTFSYRADDKKLDEYEYMKAVVDSTSVNAKYTTPKHNDFLQEVDNLIFHQDEPFSTTGMFAGYCVYREASKNGVKVLLDGQGADEFLCGYRKSRIYYLKKLIHDRKLIRAFKEFIFSISQIKTSIVFGSNRKSDLNKLLRIIKPGKKISNTSLEFLCKEFMDTSKGYDYHRNDNFQYNDVFKISLPSLLRYTDRNSMAFSVESRLPFLDYRFAEMCADLPLSVKLNNGYSKYIMREALILPEKIKKRKDKLGFVTPEDSWIKESEKELKVLFENEKFKATRYVNREMILKHWEEIIYENKIPYFFRIVCLEKWMQIFNVN